MKDFNTLCFMECNKNYRIEEYVEMQEEDFMFIIKTANAFNIRKYKDLEDFKSDLKNNEIDIKNIVKYKYSIIGDKYIYLKNNVPIEVPLMLNSDRSIGEHISRIYNLVFNNLEKGEKINYFLIPQFLLLDFFLKNYCKMSKKQKREIFETLYNSMETDFDKFTREMITECFVLGEEDKKKLKKISKNNELVIYRG